ncbi:hypothetical protein HBO08_27560 [Pseudomonas rhodesiae]|jgi:hypothetical protein|uniref:Uncharacterized protein n=2 Tax=Pseudomonas TaxID=286 RepID=A0A8I1EB56_9PSED|nr:hypothetical protein [Pseudomonas sp. S4_EA_1b]MBI6628029.1 hypothetical protein [Pseudomonas rhodesiae]NMZ20743.1 hypothetical protein [Pseudomonas rhodesiae]
MSYGMQFTNNDNTVVLDSEFSRLVVLHRGDYSGPINFPTPITSQEPPLVFIRPNGSFTLSYARINGSAGNWTGFSFVGGGSGKYFAAAFLSQPTAKYGFRLWDGNSKLLFDSGTPCAQFTRTISSWTFIGSSSTGQGTTQINFSAASPLNTGDYMMINNIGMDVSGANIRTAKLYCTWDYANNRIVMFTVGVSNVMSLFVPVVFAKPVI